MFNWIWVFLLYSWKIETLFPKLEYQSYRLCSFKGCQPIIFKNIYSFYLKIFFTFENSVDPGEMQHYAAFHLGLHWLQKHSFRGFPEFKGLNTYA